MEYPAELSAAVNNHPYKLLFATVSGAYLYGFSSPDSDFDLRGAHILPIAKLIGFEEHDELKELGKGCITVHHSHQYLGFSANQCKLFENLETKKVKPLLYVFRVLLTGIHLMRTGQIEANLSILNQHFKLSYIEELINYKANSREKATLPNNDIKFYGGEYQRLRKILEEETAISKLPISHDLKPALEDLLIRLRLSS